MLEDGDTVLNLVGAVLILAVVAGLVVVGLNFSGSAGEQPPEADWTIERINDTHVRVTHASGDPVRTDELRVTADSVRRAANWTDPVSDGESAVIPASDGSLIRIVWNGGRGDRSIMAQERV
jgi:FlaG/FlaF family flagellin (archaellin)